MAHQPSWDTRVSTISMWCRVIAELMPSFCRVIMCAIASRAHDSMMEHSLASDVEDVMSGEEIYSDSDEGGREISDEEDIEADLRRAGAFKGGARRRASTPKAKGKVTNNKRPSLNDSVEVVDTNQASHDNGSDASLVSSQSSGAPTTSSSANSSQEKDKEKANTPTSLPASAGPAITTNPKFTLPAKPVGRNKKRKGDTPEGVQQQLLSLMAAEYSRPPPPPVSQPISQKEVSIDSEDEDKLFLLSLLPDLKQLPARKRAFLKAKWQMQLAETLFGVDEGANVNQPAVSHSSTPSPVPSEQWGGSSIPSSFTPLAASTQNSYSVYNSGQENIYYNL